jgi:hypothetical protein
MNILTSEGLATAECSVENQRGELTFLFVRRKQVRANRSPPSCHPARRTRSCKETSQEADAYKNLRRHFALLVDHKRSGTCPSCATYVEYDFQAVAGLV